ncbi:hypothetical protein M2352_003922 [Azospirillum fermentarium]|uniref:major capsid protein n=1 Tax=Azospirillum fermentarium TaxID=1233114 RepID=UPI002227C165|nr:major capsid protein [Azospirillum fermentarium]MCW2248288.1 hypothetical protein [Azospirillum fermentarium]
MVDIYDTRVLVGVVSTLPRPKTFILDNFFPTISESVEETILFDVVEGSRRLAPFVAPSVAGRVVRSRGYTTQSFRPAYVKDKRVLNPNRAVKRLAGEAIGGSMTPEQRRNVLLKTELQEQVDMLTRRQEAMAMEALVTGKTTVTGDDYPTQIVDFKRKPALTKVLTGGARWGVVTNPDDPAYVDPVNDLERWCGEVFKASGIAPTDVLLTQEAWELIKKSPRFKDAIDLNKRGGSASAELGIIIVDGVAHVATMGAVRLWVYNDYYEDDDGNEVAMLPAYGVLILSRGVQGVRHYGAILDDDVLQAMAYFPKSWKQEDPSVRFLLLQSAPLPVPYRINASMFVKVR